MTPRGPATPPGPAGSPGPAASPGAPPARPAGAALRAALLSLLAVLGVYVGGWAYAAPASWYRAFPGIGLHWLPVLGPYNEHLSKDVGAFYLALAALSLTALRRVRDDRLAQAAGVTWLVFSVPHLVYHLQHLDMYGTRDEVLNVVALGFFVVAGAALLVPLRPLRGEAAGPPAASPGRHP